MPSTASCGGTLLVPRKRTLDPTAYRCATITVRHLRRRSLRHHHQLYLLHHPCREHLGSPVGGATERWLATRSWARPAPRVWRFGTLMSVRWRLPMSPTGPRRPIRPFRISLYRRIRSADLGSATNGGLGASPQRACKPRMANSPQCGGIPTCRLKQTSPRRVGKSATSTVRHPLPRLRRRHQRHRRRLHLHHHL